MELISDVFITEFLIFKYFLLSIIEVDMLDFFPISLDVFEDLLLDF